MDNGTDRQYVSGSEKNPKCLGFASDCLPHLGPAHQLNCFIDMLIKNRNNILLVLPGYGRSEDPDMHPVV